MLARRLVCCNNTIIVRRDNPVLLCMLARRALRCSNVVFKYKNIWEIVLLVKLARQLVRRADTYTKQCCWVCWRAGLCVAVV
jgi:hypothetical protein